MNRFWVFPLVLGIVGALYGAFCVAQTWAAILAIVSTRWFRWSEVGNTFHESAVWGFLVGVVVGLAVAAGEALRFGARDRSGWKAVGRLLGNGWWVGVYALLGNGATFVLAFCLVKAGVLSARTALYWLPGLFFIGFGGVNLAAILWAAIRSAATDDVLSPRVLLAKVRRSTRLAG